MRKTVLFRSLLLILALGLLSCAGGKKQTRDDEISFGNADDIGGTGTKIETAEGMAEVRSAGKDEAYDRAIENALRKCIEEALGTIVDARILGDSGVILEENIYAKKQGYIKKYEIKSKKIDDGVAYVTVTAVVGLQKLKDDVMALGILQHRMNLPKVIIIINEFIEDKPSTQKASYNVVLTNFKNREFVIISPTDISPEYKKHINQLSVSMEQDENAFISTAGKIGMDVNADLVIAGKVEAKKSTIKETYGINFETGGMKSMRINLNFKTVNVGDGRIIAASTKNAGGVGASVLDASINGIERAADPAADDLISQILKAWEDILNNGNLITLYASGLSLTEELKFSKAVKSYFREVKEVYSKQKKGNYSVFTVKFLGTPRDLAMALSTKETFPYKVSVQKYDFGQVTVSAAVK